MQVRIWLRILVWRTYLGNMLYVPNFFFVSRIRSNATSAIDVSFYSFRCHVIIARLLLLLQILSLSDTPADQYNYF